MKSLEPYRARIDEIDDRIVDLLAARINVIREVGLLKFRENLPAVLPERVNQVYDRTAARAENQGLDPALVRALYKVLVEYSCDLEAVIMRDLAATKKAVGEK